MSFLRDYLTYCESNEAHQTYHLWSALVTLSSIVSRRVWIDQGHYVVYGNLYVVLVGPPGNRKTTGMTVAKKMMREVGGIPFSAEAMTKEGLVKAMAANEQSFMVGGIPKMCSAMTVCVTELKEFIGSSNERMINFLTTIYDQDFYDYKTRNMEDLIITNPYLTILACETPEWITLRLKDDVISGGFSRRAIFAYPMGGRKRIAFPSISKQAHEAWARALAHATVLKDLSGEFKWENDAKIWYKHWYENLKIPQDSTLAGYYESKQIQLLKVAMLLACSESTDLIMRKSYLLAALDILDEMEKTLPRVFEGMGRNELNAVSTRVIDILTISKDPISEKQLRAVTWRFADGFEFDKVIAHLSATERITIWKQGTGKFERKFVCLKGNEPEKVKAELNKADVQAASQQEPEPSDAPLSDSKPVTDQPSEKSLTHDEIMSLLQESPPDAPSASASTTNPSPKDDQP